MCFVGCSSGILTHYLHTNKKEVIADFANPLILLVELIGVEPTTS